MKRYNKIKRFKFSLTLFSLVQLFSGCEKIGYITEEYVDPHIIYSSLRWWNYDIFASDIYNEKDSHITKNQWLDFSPTVNTNGDKIAFITDRDGNREIYYAQLNWMDGYYGWRADSLENLTNSSGHEWTPRFSPDSQYLLYSYYVEKYDNYDVFLYDLEKKIKTNLTNTPLYEINPQFSPDGSFIVYQSWQGGVKEIFFLNILEKNQINISKSSQSNDILPTGNAFSPDGKGIVFTSDRAGNKDIFTMNINSTAVKKLTNSIYDEYDPEFSPDGQFILFTREINGNKDIFIMNNDGSYPKQLTSNESNDWNARFYPKNDKIVFQTNRDGNWEIYIMDINGANKRNLSQNPNTDFSFTFLPIKD